MKALVLTEKNKPIEVHEVDDLTAGKGEAIVQVRAAAINHRDLWIQKGQYGGLKYPIIPGSDGAGVVVQIGKLDEEGDTRTRDWMGKSVLINPALHWGLNNSFQDPDHFRILGLPDDGCFAQFVKVPVENLVAMPSHLSFMEAAALPLAGATAYRALMTRGRVKAGEKVLISGIGGGVALFALQYAVAIGAQVFITSSSDEKLVRAISMGACGGANYNNPEWITSLRNLANSFDLTIDGTAGDPMGDLLDLAAPGGRLVFYGATRGNPSNLVARRIFWKQLDILGSTMASPEDFRLMIDFVIKHSLRPNVDRIFPFAQGEEALRWMDEGRQFGKIVLDMMP